MTDIKNAKKDKDLIIIVLITDQIFTRLIIMKRMSEIIHLTKLRRVTPNLKSLLKNLKLECIGMLMIAAMMIMIFKVTNKLTNKQLAIIQWSRK